MHDLDEKTGSRLTHRNPSSHKAGASINKPLFITIGIAAVLLIAIWVWKAVEINNLREDANKTRQALKEQAQQQLIQTHEEYLKLLAKAYVWAVREELMRGNINQVNLYANDMVKEKNFQRIAVANDKGIIISSTNKKDEGSPFSTIGPDVALRSDTTSIENLRDSILIMTSPIMGFNNRLGTLLIAYTIPRFNFREPNTEH